MKSNGQACLCCAVAGVLPFALAQDASDRQDEGCNQAHK